MSRKRRTPKDRRYALDDGVRCAALDVDWWESHWGGPEEGRRAWAALRGRLLTNPGTRPAPFWQYEAHVPDDLRIAARDPHHGSRFHLRAARWLLNGGQDHLREGETAAILQSLPRLEMYAASERDGDPRQVLGDE